MFKRILITFIPSLLASLLAGWLLKTWSSLEASVRLIISSIIGVLILALLVVLTKQSNSKSLDTRIASNLRAKKNVHIKDIELTESSTGNTELASDITSENGSVDISDIKMDRGTNSDEKI